MSHFVKIGLRDVNVKSLFPVGFDSSSLIEDVLLRKPYLDTNITASDSFSKSVLSGMSEHRWMKSCSFICVAKSKPEDVFGQEFQVFESMSDFISMLRAESIRFGHDQYFELGSDKYLLGCDLETTGLDVTVRSVGGDFECNTAVVGVCVAVSGSKAFYLPFNHTESDGVLNWSDSDLFELASFLLSKDVVSLWYNSQFDISLLSSLGIELEGVFFDLYLLFKQMCNYEFSFIPKAGLKNISEHYLGRKMLEIEQLMGMKGDRRVAFETLPAVNATVYGSSDAMNTYALFDLWVLKDRDLRNPLVLQRSSVKIDRLSFSSTMGMLRYGMPFNYDYAFSLYKTVIRRIYLMRTRFDYIARGVSVGSTEQVGRVIFDILLKDWTGDESSLESYITKISGMEIKRRETKSKGLKVTYSSGDDVLTKLKKALSSVELSFMSDVNRKCLSDVIDIVSNFRGLQHDAGILSAMIRAVKIDDRGFPYFNISLVLNGTDTGRYSNRKSKGVARVKVGDRGKLEFLRGDGVVTTLNALGLPGRKYSLAKARKIVGMSESIKRNLNLVSNKVDAEVRDILFSL